MSDEAAVAEFSDETKALGDQIAGLTLLEAKSLADYLEEVHGIKPAGGAVMVAGGGGGRGIRRIENEQEMVENIPLARSEAKAAFNDDRVYLEKVVLTPKHIEVQVIADKDGNTVHLGTRDCSIQRRNQKLVEIAPSLIDDKALLDNICDTAVRAAKAASYRNAGTVEFLVDADSNTFYFIIE